MQEGLRGSQCGGERRHEGRRETVRHGRGQWQVHGGALRHPLVCSNVFFEVVFAAEAFVTQRAREGSRPAVDTTVPRQFLVAGEALLTALVTTDERSLARVDAKVAFELTLVAEGRATLAAPKPLGPRPPGTHSLHFRRRHQHIQEWHQRAGSREAAEGPAQTSKPLEDGAWR